MRNFISEDDIEQAILQKLEGDPFQYGILRCDPSPDKRELLPDGTGRSSKKECVLPLILREALARLNPGIPGEKLEEIARDLCRDFSATDMTATNYKYYNQIRNGIKISLRRNGKEDFDFVKLVDFDCPENNTFTAVSQMWIQGRVYWRRPDVLIFINGLPMVFVELNNSIVKVEEAYNDNLKNYLRDIPNLFAFNQICVLSNGLETRLGAFNATYNHFFEWLNVDSEKERPDRQALKEAGTVGESSVRYFIDGLLRKDRLIDYIENFIMFRNQKNKIIAKNHQYFGVNNLMESVRNRAELQGKLGVFWHTQGSGKSFSMVFFARKVRRKIPGNFTFLIITDREDLDDQIHKNFVKTEVIGQKEECQPKNGKQLRDYLQTNKSFVFTLIHKFRYEKGKKYPVLSTRDDIIVLVDEAHRTQNNLDMKLVLKSDEVLKRYGFAKFLHTALPQATYIGFTGTPVDATMDVFGPVIDQYTMTDSVKDGITVRLVYDGRPARATLDDNKVQEIEEYYKQCLAEGSNQYQVDVSKKAVTNMAAIVGDDDVLNSVADYFIDHYETRVREGSTVAGKAMFVCLNRPIAFKFYNILKEKRPEWFELKVAPDGVELSEQDKKELIPMPMCQFVATRSKDDPQDMYDLLGNDSVRKTAATQFKNIKSNFKIAIVVDLWLTGFDVPFLDTMYIDKPITQSHTIIQTVSRVNRSYAGKDSGLIVDFIGIKLGLLAALRNYTDFREDSFDEDSVQAAIRVVRNQVEVLDAMMHGFDNKKYFTGTPSEKLQCLNEAAEFIQKTKDLEQRFMSNVLRMSKAFNLCNSGKDFTKYELDVIHYYKAVRSILFKLTKGDAPDTDTMNAHVREMLEGAIQSEGVEEVFSTDTDVDAEAVDLFSEEYLERISRIKLPNTKVKILAQLLKKKVKEYKRVNKIKAVDFEERLQNILNDYNNRMTDADYIKSILDNVADQLLDLLNQLKKEENSFSSMGIDYEEKAFYDILVAVAEKFQFEYPDDKNIELAKEIRAALRDKEKYSDWANSMQIKALMQADIIMILAKNGYPPTPPEIYEKVYSDILEQTENFKKYSDD